MMLTIHGLAPNTKYQDVKILIKQVCSLDDYILDNLISEGDGTKKVRIGFPDDSGGFKLLKFLNGYRMAGNFVIKVVPVGKPAPNPNMPAVQDRFDSRPGFRPQQRPEYVNEPRNDYINQPRPSEYNRGPGMRGPDAQHGRPGGPQVPGGPQGPGGQQFPNKVYPQGPVDNIRPWSSNENAQWGPNSSMGSQNFNYNAHQNVPPSFAQQQPNRHPYEQSREGVPPGPNYGGYPPKNNIPPRQLDARQNLRNIQTVDSGHPAAAPVHGGRYPPNQQYQHEKPGPTQYNITHPGGQQPTYSQQENSPAWQQRSHQPQQSKPQFPGEKPGYDKPFEERNYHPQEQNRDPKGLLSRPDTYKEYEKRRGFSPSGRKDDPMQRRISPSRDKEALMRRDLAGKMVDMGKRRLSPPGRMEEVNQRRMSPRRMGDAMHRGVSPRGKRDDPHGRRYSPSEKRMSPGDRRNIPAKRIESPPRRLSPNRRHISPSRKDDRQASRYSPGRHHADKMVDKYGHDNSNMKKVRPAYEPSPHAQNQAMYSGGYRSDVHDNAKYPISGTRQEQPVPWQRHRDETIVKNQEDRLDARMPSGRLIDKVDKRFSPTRKSRSPNRRDRSPIRDRYRRNSRSPRSSHSPRRSWALEKRRSPETPPPPLWPGQNAEPHRAKIPEKDEKPVWKTRSFQDEENRNLRSEDRRQYEEAKIRIAKDLERNPPASLNDRHYQREPKFTPRDTYDERRDNYRRPDSPEHKPRMDDLPRRGREEVRSSDYNPRRESPSHDIRKDSKFFDKDFEDIYNRALQFKKRAEQMRKSNSKKKEEFEDDHRQSVKEREDVRQPYEERPKYRDEGFQPLREREDRPRDDRAREEKPRDDRAREDYIRNERTPYHDADRSRYQAPDSQQERNKSIDDNKAKQLAFTDNSVKATRNKAIREIAEKILERSVEYKDLQGEHRNRLIEELQLSVARIVYDMFGDTDVSFIEMIIKYQARYNLKDEAKILEDVVASLPKQFRTLKRPATVSSAHPTKISRHSTSADLKTENRRLPAAPPKPQRVIKRPAPNRESTQHFNTLSQRNEAGTIKENRRLPAEPPKLQRAIKRPAPKRESTQPFNTSSQRNEAETIKENRCLPAEPPKPQRAIKRPAPKRESTQHFNTSSQRNEAGTIKEAPMELKPNLEERDCKGGYELNKLMTKVVDAELDDIIPKVQEVFTEATSESDIFREIRSKVCDDLRNVLGLNITKRLLNVHNPLYVKIKFHGKPEKEDLREFLKKYHFTAFARKAVNIFAARLRSIEDFDNLCSNDNVQCGNVKMTVSPVYRFTSCPPNLITKYKDIGLKEEPEDSTKDINVKKTQAVEESNKTTATTANKSPIKAELSKPTQISEKAVITTTTESKPTPTKTTTNKTTSQTTINTMMVESRATPQNSTTEKTVSQSTVNTATLESKTTPQTTIVKTTTQTSVKTTVATTTPQKPVTKTTISQPQILTKVTPINSKYSTKTVATKSSNTTENDYDELDDHDILALISEGIVLDECRGSDEE